MTIASEITKLNTNLTASYTACNNKGATMPANQNFDNLANCIGSIQTGSTPTLITKNITQNGTYNASSDNADGYSSVTVNVSGGGGTTYSYPNVVGNYYVLADGSIYPMSFYSANDSKTKYLWESDNGVAYTDGDSPSFSTVLTLNSGSFNWGIPLVHISFASFGHANSVTFSASWKVFRTTDIKASLKSVRISDMRNIALPSAFSGCSNLEEADVSTIRTIPLSMALGGGSATGGTFANTAIQTLSFNSLLSTAFGSRTNQFNNMLKGVTGCTVHFPSNLQSVIGSWSSVTSGFGGTNTTVLFDLPATT